MKKPLSSPPGRSSSLSEREAYWGQHLERWRTSGLSQGEYSRSAGLRANQLSYWHRRDQRQHQAPSPSSGSGFIPVKVNAALSTAAPPLPSLSIVLSSGARIEGIGEKTMTLAVQLARAL